LNSKKLSEEQERNFKMEKQKNGEPKLVNDKTSEMNTKRKREKRESKGGKNAIGRVQA